jgi:hypothetical protein
MTTPVPPSSRLPNVRAATGTVVAEAERWVTEATREFLRQQGVKLLKPLGKAGAYGAVFEATDSMQRPLAVKIVKNPSDRESRKRHLRECQVLSAGKIPADLAPYCYMAHKAKLPGEAEWNNDLADGVQPFLVMSRIPGREVHEYVGGDRPLAMSERLELVSRLFEALGASARMRVGAWRSLAAQRLGRKRSSRAVRRSWGRSGHWQSDPVDDVDDGRGRNPRLCAEISAIRNRAGRGMDRYSRDVRGRVRRTDRPAP